MAAANQRIIAVCDFVRAVVPRHSDNHVQEEDFRKTVILTITPNPSIDLLFEADRLLWDDANRVEMPRRRAGGQGVNLTRAARLLGADSIALAFFGGATGEELKQMLANEGVAFIDVPINHDTRTFVAVRERETGRSMLVNARGVELTEDDRAHLLERVESVCREQRPEWVVCSGSIPRGLGTDLYAFIGKIATSHGAKFIADCDGDALTRALDVGCDLLCPNQHEAERLADVPITSVQEGAAAAESLLRAARRVIVKLGANGAVYHDGRTCIHAKGPSINSGSAVGAGDAFLAAFLVAEKNGAPVHEALRRAVAAGGAVLLSEGSDLLTKKHYEDVFNDIVVMPV